MVEGAALSTGETTELANSYISRLGGVTRHMTESGRRERIEEAAVHWNLRKIVGLPKQLSLSIAKVCVWYLGLLCVTLSLLLTIPSRV